MRNVGSPPLVRSMAAAGLAHSPLPRDGDPALPGARRSGRKPSAYHARYSPPRCRGRYKIYGPGRPANRRKHLNRDGRSDCATGAMRDFLARRLLSIVAGAFALSILVFVLVRLVPGD